VKDVRRAINGRIRNLCRCFKEPFFTTKTVGNGLGLAIAYRIIKRHHGRIEAASRVGQGIEVSIYLPLTKLEMVNMMSIPAG
jgi:nitrogen-specific signal transduction histidine kinase